MPVSRSISSTHFELPTPYQQQIHQSKYARWDDAKGRRETWNETVDRFIDFVFDYAGEYHNFVDDDLREECRFYTLNQDVLGSMRALMTAGPALARDHVAAYNCSYIEVNHPRAFWEAMYILMCGTGVGFSVERRLTERLPAVPAQFTPCADVIQVADSKIGWAEALRKLLGYLWEGKIPSWDLSAVRPAGAILKTFGGRASGPGPLDDLLHFTVELFINAAGRKLKPIECHGLMCKVGEIVVVGGVRRSALISLSNFDDDEMRGAKHGEWWKENSHFSLANNSVVWESKPSREDFDLEWAALVASGSGERGLFNREAAQYKASHLGRREFYERYGLNPCGEILLKDREFCNLSQVTVRPYLDMDHLSNSVRIAAVLGTLQSTFTKFRYLSDQWQKNCEQERLLGVGMTGVMEHDVLNGNEGESELRYWLRELKGVVRNTNTELAKRLQIKESAATTCMKPAGNSTQLVGGHGSGMHDAHSKFYVRRNRANKNDPVAQVLYMAGVPCEDEIHSSDTTWVFSWPMKVTNGTVVREDRSAIERLEHWLIYAEEWCEHNPSMTVNVKPEEWEDVGNWVYDHIDKMVGVSFLPYSEHTYQQAPYEEITEEQYESLLAEMPKEIDWSMLQHLEKEDRTEGAQELACFGGASCDIV